MTVPELRDAWRESAAGHDVVDGRADARRIESDDAVGAVGHRNRPFRVLSERQAGNAEHGRFLLDAARVGQHQARIVEERQEVEIAKRLDDRRARAERIEKAELLQLSGASRVQRQDDRQAVRQLRHGLERSLGVRAGVDVARPVQRARGVFARGQRQSREHGAALAGDRAVLHQRVDHHVADEVDLLGRDAFGAQIVGGVALGGEQIVGNLVGQDAVDFFRHAAVAAAKAGLDMGDLNAALHRDERAAERRIDVADDQDDVGGMIVERLVERGHDARGLHRVARGAHFEMEVGVRNLKVAKELRRHMVVVVLPGVHQSQLDGGDVSWAAWMIGRDFHEIRPGTGDDRDFQEYGHPKLEDKSLLTRSLLFYRSECL